MEPTFWIRQSSNKPLYQNLLWSRPEQKQQAGKLLIIGGNAYGFSSVAEAYSAALDAGIGTIRVMLPTVLEKTVGKLFDVCEFVPSTPSGSFALTALSPMLENLEWADAILFAGDFGRNSETAIVVEKMLAKSKEPAVLTEDAVDYFSRSPGILLTRHKLLLVLSIAQLRELGRSLKFTPTFTLDMELFQLVSSLHLLTSSFELSLVVEHRSAFCVAVHGQVSTTQYEKRNKEIRRIKAATHGVVWWLQNPGKEFEALTTAMYGLATNTN